MLIETEKERMERIINEERMAKRVALYHLEMALSADDKLFRFILIDDDTVQVTDVISGYTRQVNVAYDNVPAMLLDILKQAGDWIM